MALNHLLHQHVSVLQGSTRLRGAMGRVLCLYAVGVYTDLAKLHRVDLAGLETSVKGPMRVDVRVDGVDPAARVSVPY